MPGLLDFLNPSTPEQQQGLLSAAAAILNASGPSLTPHSFGQVIGSGLTAYQQVQDQQLQRAMQALQMRKAGLEVDQLQGTVDRQNRIRDRLTGKQAPQQAASLAAPEATPANYMPGGENSPRIGGPAWMQAYQTQQQGKAPAMPAPVASGGKSATQQLVDRLTTAAGVYSDEGDIEGANKLLEQAAKFMPEVHKIEVAMYGGKPVNVITFKDGTQKVSEFGATPKLHFADNGTNTAIPFDEITGAQVGSGIKKGYSPSDLITMRGQNMTDARARELNAITAGNKAPTEFQGKSAAFGLRATEADKILSGLEKEGVTNTGLIKGVAQGIGGLVPFMGDRVGSAIGSSFNALPSVLGGPNEKQQQVEQARRDFVNAILRQESGAAISTGEFDNATKQYFPQPGDSPAVIAQKARNRQLAIQGLQANAGKAALTAAPQPGAGGIKFLGFE